MQSPQTIQPPISDQPTSSIRETRDPAGLRVFFEPDTNAVVYRRALNEELREEARRAMAMGSFQLLAAVTPDEAGYASLASNLPAFPHLARDLQTWIQLIADLTGCARVGVRLARVKSAMCPRFHVDWVTVRAVAAYEGAGTELIADGELDRRWMGHRSGGACDEESGLLRRGARIRRVSTGDVVFLKGESWEDNSGRGAVHRSPAASADCPRLVMTLDAL